MIIIDLPLSRIKSMVVKDNTTCFFTEENETMTFLSMFNNIFYRFIYRRQGQEQDVLFFQTNFPSAVKIVGISSFEIEYLQKSFEIFFKEIEVLKGKMEEIKNGIGRLQSRK